MIKIVLGAGFGDEGKGSVVNSLIHNPKETLVIRFNGGHQVGHTVIQDNIRHVFSNFGSGTLKGVPTYWSKFCTIHPIAILNEFDILYNKGIIPKLFIDPLAMVTTPFDIAKNRASESKVNHGSVGVGFGQTIKRNEETPFKLYAQDLLNKDILKHKLNQIINFYGYGESEFAKIDLESFLEEIDDLLNLENIQIKKPNFEIYEDIIFEGGQGILLDQDFGFFPHVTRSNTTSKNAFEIIKEFNLKDDIQIIYVSRCYLTRHGNGPLPFEQDLKFISKNPNETNVSHKYQGEFRYAPLNIDLLKHAISCDSIYSNNLQKSYIYFTCVDQVKDKITIIKNNSEKEIEFEELTNILKEFRIIFKSEE